METIEQLIQRAKVLVKKIDDHQLSAGRVLGELKGRVTDKESAEGAPWKWNWSRFIATELDLSYSHAQRLIGYHKKDDPEAALAAERKANAERAQRWRGSHTYENSAPAAQAAPRITGDEKREDAVPVGSYDDMVCYKQSIRTWFGRLWSKERAPLLKELIDTLAPDERHALLDVLLARKQEAPAAAAAE